MQANLIDNLKFEFGGGDRITSVNRARRINGENQQIADLKAKYASDENFKAWMDKAYSLGCEAIADFNAANDSTLSIKDGLQICVWGWEEGYKDFTPKEFIECLARQFENYI